MGKTILANHKIDATSAAALQRGEAALDVIEASIRPIEADPTERSVGRGGWPNLLGQVELDASMMDGRSLRTGSVGALQGYLHPISVARQIMERLPHVFLVGEGAARFAAEVNAERADNLTEEAQRDWQTWLEKHVPPAQLEHWPDAALAPYSRLVAQPEKAGTTVWLAKDARGDIAGGVSTSGWALKYPGRLGDSPVIGAGLYADNRFGAAACIGHGELTIRAGTARATVLYMKMGMGVRAAVHEALADLRALERGPGNWLVMVHAIDADGEPYVAAVGRPSAPLTCWAWREGMAEPEQRMVPTEDW